MAVLLRSRACLPSAHSKRPLHAAVCGVSPLLPHGVMLGRSRAAASGDEADTAKVITLEDATVVRTEDPAVAVAEEVAAVSSEDQAVQSHPLTDMFGAQELLVELQDQNQFGKRGEAWTFAQIAAVILVLLPPFQLTGLVDIMATLLITAGLVFIGYGVMSLGRYISPLAAPRAKHELVTTGMYNYMRHPMYGGLLMAAFGLAIVTRSETRMAMAVLLWVVLEKKVAVEEKMLLERYNKLYADYKEKVKKFFPFVY